MREKLDKNKNVSEFLGENLRHAIVITGGIGSGKSSVCAILRNLGYNIIDADSIAHCVLESAQSEVVAAFGDEILANENSTDSKKIDRKKLGKLVFSDKIKREKLEQILHPKIRQRIYQEAKECEKKVESSRQTPTKQGKNHKFYFIDIPLFFEVNAKNPHAYDISKILLIYAPHKIAKARIMQRDNLDAKAAQSRIDAQMDIELKRKKANFIIENTSDLENLEAEVAGFLQKLESTHT